jgi:predicted RND superfamily exporter protein
MNSTPRNYRLISRILLLLIAVITVAAVWMCNSIKFDYNFENFFPRGDDDLEFYLDYRERFEYDNEFALVGLENSSGIFDSTFLSKVDRFSDSLKNIENITRVLSPTQVKHPIIGPLAAIEAPYLHIDQPERYKEDSVYIYNSRELAGTLFSDDARSVTIFLKIKDELHKAPSDTLLHRIERLSASFGFEHVRIAGKIKAVYVYIDRIQEEFVIFFACSFVLVVVFLYFSFRSFWGIWLPVLVVMLSIIWTLGFMSAINKPLDLMTVLLPTMMFVVGMSDVVHIITKYLEELRDGADRFEAFRHTIKDVGLPTFLTLLTTTIGFLTLLFSNMQPIRDFGIYTSLGCFVAFVLSFTILPSVMLFMKRPIKIDRENNDLFWNKKLHRLFRWTIAKRKMLMLATALLIGLSIFGITRIHVNNFLLEDLADEDDLKKDFAFFEDHYAGVRPFEMAIHVSDSSRTIFDSEVLQAMDTIEHYLEHQYGIGFTYSPLTLVKTMNKAYNSGDPAYYSLPGDTSELNTIVTQVKKYRKASGMRSLISDDQRTGRISGKMEDIGSEKVRALNAKLDEFVKKNVKPGLISYQLTGAATIMDKNNEYLVNNMLQGLIMSVVMVALIIAFIHRSWKMVIISIIPNIIPMIVVGGLMGYFGIDLKSSTSIIFSIAFGIATDDTIHFLARLKIELSKGKSMLYAIKRTYISTGKAVIVTSLILSAGFLTLIMSSFQSTFLFGLLVSVILFIAVFTELLLLPPLLLWLSDKKKLNGK